MDEDRAIIKSCNKKLLLYLFADKSNKNCKSITTKNILKAQVKKLLWVGIFWLVDTVLMQLVNTLTLKRFKKRIRDKWKIWRKS